MLEEERNEKTILISACLLGLQCRYNAKAKPCQMVLNRLNKGRRLIPVCPEQLGGLPTPRPACEMVGGTGIDVVNGTAKVMNREKEDCTQAFLRGAREVLKIAALYSAKEAWLMARSPSCGAGRVYDGSFSGTLTDGDGVCAALLKQNGISILNYE